MAYIGQSMSVNAAIAYSSGEKPLSQWTKTEILERIKSCYGEEVASFCKNFSVNFLKEKFLFQSSWHHTGKFFSETKFFYFEESFEKEEIFQMKEEKKQKEESTFWPCIATWTDWEGTRKHPIPIDRKEYGRTDGKWFFTFSGEKKLCSGRSFSSRHLKEKELKEMKEEWKDYFHQKTSHRFEKWLATGNC